MTSFDDIDVDIDEHLAWVRWQLDQLASTRMLADLTDPDSVWYEHLMAYEIDLLRGAPVTG